MKIGFLPLYIKLYDDIGVDRTVLEEFYKNVTDLFTKRGLEVVTSEFCRIKTEFKRTIEEFEKEKVDAVVTWHAAYSPSLEVIEALSDTKLPIIVFDSTPTIEFTPQQDTDEINWNHGIHGVMDMCSMLKRYGKPYAIAAGHCSSSNVIDRVYNLVRSAVAAKKLASVKVGLVGGRFEGMGDFAVSPEELHNCFGITVETIDPDCFDEIRKSVSEAEIQQEIDEDHLRYDFDSNVIEEEYRAYTLACLTLRKCIEKYGYNAFSANFLNIEKLGTMPFTECCKAMERGIGYAGEGDALTAAFTGAFLSAYPETNFVEIFCPDWNNNNVFMSHMGEINFRIADGRPLISRTNTIYVKGEMPYAGYSRMKDGTGIYVNVSRDRDGYQLLIAPARILPVNDDNFIHSVRGWMQPEYSKSTAEFLEKLSENGATHHSIFIYGAEVEELVFFGKLLSMKTIVI